MKIKSFSMPDETAEYLEVLCDSLGVSQSAFVSEILGQTLEALCPIVVDRVGDIPADDVNVTVMRNIGKSLDVIKSRINELEDLANGQRPISFR